MQEVVFPDVQLEGGEAGSYLRGGWACLRFEDALAAAVSFARWVLCLGPVPAQARTRRRLTYSSVGGRDRCSHHHRLVPRTG